MVIVLVAHYIGIDALGLTCAVVVLACHSTDHDLYQVEILEDDTRVVGTFQDGKQHGRWTTWNQDGSLAKIEHFRGGKNHGPDYWLGDDGMTSDSNYFNGQLHGRSRIFYRPGQLAELSWFSKGFRERTWCSWRVDGSLEYIRMYQQDKVIRETIDPPGQCPVIFGDGARHTDPDDHDFR